MSANLARCARFGTVSMMGAFSLVVGSVAGLLLTGCGGDSSDPETNTASATTNQGVGNTASNSTSTSTSSSTSGAGGNAATTESSTAETSTTGSDGPCTMTPPPNATISDFSDWTGQTWGASGNLTGGTFGPYMGAATSDFEFVVNPTDAVLEITGTVNDYAGFGMWFGPCTDASTYTGVQFDIGGQVGEAGSMKLQFQSSENAPVDAENMRGECEAASCTNAQAAVEGITADMATIQVPFESFTGGAPVATLSPNQLLALQFQFECETDGMCAVDVTIDNLQFY